MRGSKNRAVRSQICGPNVAYKLLLQGYTPYSGVTTPCCESQNPNVLSAYMLSVYMDSSTYSIKMGFVDLHSKP